MKMLKNKMFVHAVSAILVLQFLYMYFQAYYRSVSRLLLLIVLTMLTLILPRAFSPLSFFRSLIVEIALLPVIAYSIDLSEISVSIPSSHWFFQVLTTYSSLFRFIIPVFCIMFIVACEIQEKILMKKYIPFLAVMIVTVVTAIFIPALYSISFFLFHYAIVVIITDTCEGCLYKNRRSIIIHLPYVFLYLTAIYRLWG